jgi:hypothetical protein
MTTVEFNVLFESEVVVPLLEAGFKCRGKTLYWRDDERCLSLIRMGGRMQRPGAITYVACFRHNFLRDLNEVVPGPVSTEVFSYPFKFLPSEARAIPEYHPMNLNFETEIIDYSGTLSTVSDKLVSLRTQMIHNHLPSAKQLSPARVLDQIRRNGEDAWIEALWIEDYERHLSNTQAEQGVGLRAKGPESTSTFGDSAHLP